MSNRVLLGFVGIGLVGSDNTANIILHEASLSHLSNRESRTGPASAPSFAFALHFGDGACL
jgi:hypothetical protein